MNQAHQEEWTKADLIEVAKRQKNIMWMILISLVAMFIPYATLLTGVI